jgi:hypothetical protein
MVATGFRCPKSQREQIAGTQGFACRTALVRATLLEPIAYNLATDSGDPQIP